MDKTVGNTVLRNLNQMVERAIWDYQACPTEGYRTHLETLRDVHAMFLDELTRAVVPADNSATTALPVRPIKGVPSPTPAPKEATTPVVAAVKAP